MKIMQEIKATSINVGSKILLSSMPSQFWADVKEFVKIMQNNENLSGAEKHAKVKEQLIEIFEDDLLPVLKMFGETFLDVAIKLGCLYLAAKYPALRALKKPE
jgi:hypothetical protein